MTITVEACPCGRVPLNDKDRKVCQRCGKVAQLVMTPDRPEWHPRPSGRVVWG